jgi:hypothetical protein
MLDKLGRVLLSRLVPFLGLGYALKRYGYRCGAGKQYRLCGQDRSEASDNKWWNLSSFSVIT